MIPLSIVDRVHPNTYPIFIALPSGMRSLIAKHVPPDVQLIKFFRSSTLDNGSKIWIFMLYYPNSYLTSNPIALIAEQRKPGDYFVYLDKKYFPQYEQTSKTLSERFGLGPVRHALGDDIRMYRLFRNKLNSLTQVPYIAIFALKQDLRFVKSGLRCILGNQLYYSLNIDEMRETHIRYLAIYIWDLYDCLKGIPST